MKIAIVDSGLGGLSICALLTPRRVGGPSGSAKRPNRWRSAFVEFKYVNAVPENDWGFNQMESRLQKIFFFDKVLAGIERWYQPDFIFIACHTLSALLSETAFFQDKQSRRFALPPAGMISAGVCQIVRHLSANPASGVFIFAAETTIAESIYATKLSAAGIAGDRMISRALPGVATMISNDSEGKQVYHTITNFIKIALAQMSRPFKPLYVFLGCTHYGYQAKLFEKAFQELGRQAVILDPNEAACRQIMAQMPYYPSPRHLTPDPSLKGSGVPRRGILSSEEHAPLAGNFSVEFISRYALPANEVATVSRFLSEISSSTMHALQNHTLKPDLF